VTGAGIAGGVGAGVGLGVGAGTGVTDPPPSAPHAASTAVDDNIAIALRRVTMVIEGESWGREG